MNLQPKQFKYVFVYFGDKYYPASTAHVRNFYACQGNKTTISQPEHFFLVLTCKSKSSCGFGTILGECQKHCSSCFYGIKDNDNCPKRTETRIVGGEDAPQFAFPWIVQIATPCRKKNVFKRCAGTLISKKFVASSWHCFFHKRKKRRCQLGKVFYGSDGKVNKMLSIKIIDILVPPGSPPFKLPADNGAQDSHDFAIAVLEKNFDEVQGWGQGK